MKIAATTQNGGLGDVIVPQFGRAPSFTIVEYDGEVKSVEVIQNPACMQPSGAGIMASQILVDRGVKVLLTGNVGPKAMSVLQSAGIKIYRADGLTVEEAIKRFASGLLEEITTPGGGMGKGMGRGMGRGRGGRWI